MIDPPYNRKRSSISWKVSNVNQLAAGSTSTEYQRLPRAISSSMLIVIVCLLATSQSTTAGRTPSYDQLLVDQMVLFQEFQEHMQAEAAADLFTFNGTTRIPVGSVITHGRRAIAANWQRFYDSLTFIHEDIVSSILVNANFGAFSKVITTVRRADNCTAVVPVTNWFTFETFHDMEERFRLYGGSIMSPLIVDFAAVMNTTDIHRQCP